MAVEKSYGQVFLGRDRSSQADYFGEIQLQIDQEVLLIVDESYETAEDRLLLNRTADRTRPTAQVKLSPTLVTRRTTAAPPARSGS